MEFCLFVPLCSLNINYLRINSCFATCNISFFFIILLIFVFMGAAYERGGLHKLQGTRV